MRLFVFISIQCFYSVFISKVPSCICQPQWKARDTTESGSRFNRFHAISTTRRGVCLPLTEETLSHTGGSSSSWYRPNPASLKCWGERSCRFCSQAFLVSHLHLTASWWGFLKTGSNEIQMRCSSTKFEQARTSQVHTHSVDRHKVHVI